MVLIGNVVTTRFFFYIYVLKDSLSNKIVPICLHVFRGTGFSVDFIKKNVNR